MIKKEVRKVEIEGKKKKTTQALKKNVKKFVRNNELRMCIECAAHSPLYSQRQLQ